MHIAIVGAGFCGLAVAWHLTKQPDVKVVIFDPKGIGKGASGIAAGLLHPYAGAHSKLNWRAKEGLAATRQLIKVAEQALGESIISTSGILRPALTPEQIVDFSACAAKYSDTRWRSTEECLTDIPELTPASGLFIESGSTVNCPLYLKGLWQACLNTGRVTHKQMAVKSLMDLSEFDRVVITMGAAATSLPELAHLPIRSVKGQILEFRWPQGVMPLPYPVNSQAYLLMNPDNKSCIAGATFEREYMDEGPDRRVALNDILPKVQAFFPKLLADAVLDCRAGIRASTFGHHPLLVKASEKCWVLSGMGSKGLLYHALFAEELAAGLLNTRSVL